MIYLVGAYPWHWGQPCRLPPETFKVGHTAGRTAAKRIRDLQQGVPLRLVLLKTWPLNRSVERYLHAQLQPVAIRGEWYTTADARSLEFLAVARSDGDLAEAIARITKLAPKHHKEVIRRLSLSSYGHRVIA